MSYPLDERETINMLVRRVGDHSKSHGFQEDWELAAWLEEYADGQSTADAEKLRAAAKALRANFLGMKLALMHSEISEALERLRDVGVDAIVAGDRLFIEELGDVDIRTMETSAILGSDLGREIDEKITRNRARPYKHGREH